MPNKTSLRTGEKLRIGEAICSASSNYFLVVQGDGNLCVVKGDPERPQGGVWCARSQAEPGGDYFAVMQGDGNFCVYRENGSQPPVWSWDTGPIRDAGTDFAAIVEDNGNLTINEVRSGGAMQPRWATRRKLRLLTFNLHLMEDSNLEAGAALTGEKPVVFQDTTRRAHIIARIIDSGADIVALQEVWAATWMDLVIEHLARVYPHHCRGSKGAPARGGSGIILLSKFPISDKAFSEFRGASDFQEKMATKGAIYATIDLPEGVKIRVGCTHAWTDAGGDECANMKDLLGWTVTGRPAEDQTYPAVMMGDFNVHRYGDPRKFGKLNEIMASGKAADSWNMVNPAAPARDAYTDDSRENNLAEFFCPMRNTAGGDCIDFVYLRNGDTTALRPLSARVPRDWSYNSANIQPYWYWVHSGTVTGLPSITEFGDNRLCVATRTAGYKDQPDGALQLSIYNPADKTWTHRTDLNDGKKIICDGSPAIVAMGSGALVFTA